MTKVLRKGKVLLDWSQNNAGEDDDLPVFAARPRAATVAAPRTWGRAEEAAGSPSGLRQLEFDDVIARVQELGDVTAGVLPEPGGRRPGRGS
jgi:bifunctional non-homologous end joining protein LigD